MLKKLTVREVSDFEERTAEFGPADFCLRFCTKYCELYPDDEFEDVFLWMTY